MIKRHFSDFARGKLKKQNKDPTAFHVVRCSPSHHNSKPKGKLFKNTSKTWTVYIATNEQKNSFMSH